MEILKISKTEKEAVVRLSVEEMKVICNMFYRTGEKIEGDPLYHQLYSEMLIANDLAQYGHIDNFCFRQVVKERNLATIDCGGEKNGINE